MQCKYKKAYQCAWLVICVSDFEYFCSSSSFGSVLFFSDFHCNQHLQFLLINSNKWKKLQWLKTKAWWKLANAYNFPPHGDRRHYWYISLCLLFSIGKPTNFTTTLTVWSMTNNSCGFRKWLIFNAFENIYEK